MMKKYVVSFLSLFYSVVLSAQPPYEFDHGPYLQELTEEGVTVVFTTNRKGVGWVELQRDGAPVERYYASENGLRDAYTTFNAVRVEGLEPAGEYAYRICSKEIVGFQPYEVTFGDSIASKWYRFSTPDPDRSDCSVIALSDMHGDSAKLARLLGIAGVESADMVFYVGDMMDYYDRKDQPFSGYIDKSVELFASEKPFVAVRGNHETRGCLAREYADFTPRRDGRYYGAYRVGDVLFVVLDCGEDKPDGHWVYAGLVDFDAYRTRQAEWFAELIRTREYRSARWHVVMNHFPPLAPEGDEGHGLRDMTRKFLPLFNEAGIDLMISGHMHRYDYLGPCAERNFPVVVGSTQSVARIDFGPRTMKVTVQDADRTVLLEKEFER